MKMKIQKVESNDEKTVLIGMIVDDTVCGRIASKWNREMFRSKWSNLVGSWCVKHFERYQKAPGQKIEDRFRSWAERSKDDSTISLVEQFLSGLSEEWDPLKRDSNSDYVLDVAGKHFALVQQEKLKEELEDAIADKDPDKASDLLSQFTRINLGSGEWIDPFQDKEAIKEAFESNTEPLIHYPGDLGKFYGDRLERDGLICFEGPEKRGKTFLLMDIVFRGVEQRRKVAYWQVGDMSRNQIMRRLMVRVSQHPLKPGAYKIPRKILLRREEQEGKPKIMPDVKADDLVFEEGLDWRKALKACKDFQRKQIKSLDHYLRMCVHPNNTVSVRDIHGALTEWSREGWVADVVVIDYADILRMDYPGMEKRDQINQTWMDLRRLSQEFHCLVVTATQTNAASYKAAVVKREHFSEDKRKRAHSTGNIGLNQSEQEKKLGVMRLNWIQLREGEYLESRCVYVAGNPALGNLCMRSSFLTDS